MTDKDLATRIVERIWDDLCGRSGFDLYSLDDDIQEDVRETWKKIIAEEVLGDD